MTNSDPRKIDFSSYLYLGICISPYFQINIDTFTNDELIATGGVISAIMYIENLGTIEEYTEETIVILNNMIQNKIPENSDVLYDKVLPWKIARAQFPVAKLSIP